MALVSKFAGGREPDYAIRPSSKSAEVNNAVLRNLSKYLVRPIVYAGPLGATFKTIQFGRRLGGWNANKNELPTLRAKTAPLVTSLQNQQQTIMQEIEKIVGIVDKATRALDANNNTTTFVSIEQPERHYLAGHENICKRVEAYLEKAAEFRWEMELQDRQLAGNKESLLREKPHHWTYEFNTVYWTEIYLKGVLPCVKALYELQAHCRSFDIKFRKNHLSKHHSRGEANAGSDELILHIQGDIANLELFISQINAAMTDAEKCAKKAKSFDMKSDKINSVSASAHDAFMRHETKFANLARGKAQLISPANKYARESKTENAKQLEEWRKLHTRLTGAARRSF